MKVRDSFIHGFFHAYNMDYMAYELIPALDKPKNVVPEEFFAHKRMLLYVCHIWKYFHETNAKADFFQKDQFWNHVFELMRLNYNKKYPAKVMSKEVLIEMRKKIASLDAENLTRNNLNEMFGDKADVFYFGIVSAAHMYDGSEEFGQINPQITKVSVPVLAPGFEQAQLKPEEKEENTWLTWKLLCLFTITFFLLLWLFWKHGK